MQSSQKWLQAALVGLFLFLPMYAFSVLNYQGGSLADPTARGFSFKENFWCDVLQKETYNGTENTLRAFSILATAWITSCLCIFWMQVPDIIQIRSIKKEVIQLFGSLSMVFLMFLFTPFHDSLLTVSGGFGLVAFVLLLDEFRRLNVFLSLMGLLALVSMVWSELVFQIGINIGYLPIYQKISFIFFIFWVMSSMFYFVREDRKSSQKKGHPNGWPFFK